MPPTRSRATGLAVASSLLLTLGALAAPAAAADSPEAAVNGLLDAVEAGQYEAIGSLVCEAEQASVRAMLDPSEAMGFGADALMEALTFAVEDRAVEVVEQEGETATVTLSGSMAMNVSEDDVEALAMAIVESELGPDASEDDIALMLPFIEMAFSQSVPLEEELELVVEDGEWVVCGGLGEPVTEDDLGFEPVVSTEGVCGLASPDELNAVGLLRYDSADGFETFCNFSTSDFENYHSTNVSVEWGRDAESTARAYGADQQLQVSGSPAWAPGPDGFSNLIVQAGSDVLIVNVGVPPEPPEGFDWLAQATAVTELLLPRLAEARTELAPATPEPTPEPTPEVPLCDPASMATLNEQTGLGFDQLDSYADSCQFISSDMEPGLHMVLVLAIEGTLDEYRQWLPDMEDATIAGLPGLAANGQYIAELPGGTRLLQISPVLDTGDEGLTVDEAQVAALVVELLVVEAADA